MYLRLQIRVVFCGRKTVVKSVFKAFCLGYKHHYYKPIFNATYICYPLFKILKKVHCGVDSMDCRLDDRGYLQVLSSNRAIDKE